MAIISEETYYPLMPKLLAKIKESVVVINVLENVVFTSCSLTQPITLTNVRSTSL